MADARHKFIRSVYVSLYALTCFMNLQLENCLCDFATCYSFVLAKKGGLMRKRHAAKFCLILNSWLNAALN